MGEGVGLGCRIDRRSVDEGTDTMRDSIAVSTQTRVHAVACTPRYHCAHDDGTHSVSVLGDVDFQNVYLCGTLDELAAFVLELAGVVRELNAREMARAS